MWWMISGRLGSISHRLATSCLILFLACQLFCSVSRPAVARELKAPQIRSSIPSGVQIYFATTRLNDGSRTSPQYGGARHLDLGSGSLEFGTAALPTPKNMLSPNQAKSGIQYRDLLKLDTDLWRSARVNFMGCFSEEDLLEKVRKCKGKICIYVHGYDKPFTEALQDASMLFADYLQFSGEKHQLLPILFSWPSAGGRSKYSVDESNLEWSKRSFKLFMDRIIKEKNPDASLDLIGHSMGNQLIFSYLTQDISESREPFINNLFLCAADLDFHTVEACKDKIEEKVSKLVYVTVSDRDRPLIMSQYMHGEPRLGHPIDLPGAPPNDTNTPGKSSSADFWLHVGLEAAEFWFGPTTTDTTEVLAWLAQNPSLDQEFGKKTRLLDVTDLSLHTMGHGVPWSLISAIMAGYLDFPQLNAHPVHKRPDKTYLNQCGGKPRLLYRYIRLDPLQ